ncbi:hypothetical protein ACNOYE_09160 [Nannocystaceae bacterium ST9]
MARPSDDRVEPHHPVFDIHPPTRVWTWSEGVNRVVIARLDDTTGLVFATGEAAEGSTDVFEAGLRNLLARPATVLFWDLETLDRYAPKTRRMIVELLAAERKKLERIHLLSDKAMIAMAASAVNLVLGGILQVHRERETWNEAMREHLGDPIAASSASGSRPMASKSSAGGSIAGVSTAGSRAGASTASASKAGESKAGESKAGEPSSASSSGWRTKPEDSATDDSGARWRKR